MLLAKVLLTSWRRLRAYSGRAKDELAGDADSQKRCEADSKFENDLLANALVRFAAAIIGMVHMRTPFSTPIAENMGASAYKLEWSRRLKIYRAPTSP